jgi:sporulation protein YpjB
MWCLKLWKGTTLALAAALGLGLLAGCQPADKSLQEKVKPKPSQEQLQRVGFLNQTADDMYHKVMQGDVEGGRTVLQQISEQIPQIHYEGITTVEGINALTATVTEAKRVFNAVNFSPDEGQVSAAKIRLATDALTHVGNPMWLQYYKLLQDDLNQLELNAKEQKTAELQHAELKFEQHIAVIHPSLLISREPADVEKLDSFISFLSSQVRADPGGFKQIANMLPALRQHIDKLFMNKDATAFLPIIDQQNPTLWTLAIGAFILAALAFAGWRLSKKDGGLVPVRKHTQG